MKVFGLILNLIFPGIGSFFFGKYVQAIFQFIIWLVGLLFTITGLLAIIGIPIILVSWGWALATSVTGLTAPDKREKYGHRLDAANLQNARIEPSASTATRTNKESYTHPEDN